MKMNLGTCIDGKKATGINKGITVNYMRLIVIPCLTAIKKKKRWFVWLWAMKIGVLSPCHQVYILEIAIRDKQDGVGNHKRCILIVGIYGDFSKEPETVVCFN